MPAIHLDLYVIRDTDPVEFRTNHLAGAIDARLEQGRPVIVEGILLLDVLASIGRSPDFLVYVEKEEHSSTLSNHVSPYIAAKSAGGADCILEWSSAEHDAKVARAHLERSK